MHYTVSMHALENIRLNGANGMTPSFLKWVPATSSQYREDVEEVRIFWLVGIRL